MSFELKEVFLSLVRLGIGNDSAVRIPENIDWNAIKDLAVRHGLSAILVDGVEKLPEGQRPPKPVLLRWIGETLQGFECRYELYRRTIAEMASFYNHHGYKMMVLKGYACSLDWPKPEHRPCGDIDIWLFRKSREADALLKREKGIKVDKSHHHHTIYEWRDFMVENHYDFINVHHHKSNVEFEKILKEQATDDSHFVEVYGEKVFVPSPNLHALFLLKHTMIHFAAEGITLRQLLDWAFFVEAHNKEVDWEWLEGVLEKFGMTQLYVIINAICVQDLGVSVISFTPMRFEPVLKDRILQEILCPEYSSELPTGIIKRSLYKYRRWRGNTWKHELCYNESMSSAFWSGIINHLIKPSSLCF